MWDWNFIFLQIAKCEAETLIRGDSGIKTREECQFILMVGLPSVGELAIYFNENNFHFFIFIFLLIQEKNVFRIL